MPRVLCTMQISGSKSSENTVWSEEIPSYCITPVGGGTKIFLPGSRGHSLQCTEVLCYGKRIEMDDQGCPRCKTTKYRNPSLKLMVNVCGHTLCESCVELLFVRGSGTCQECNTPLRKSNFRVQLFEDPTIDKEVEIRKKIIKIFNKREEEFPSLREYNDFLEEIEEIVFNLTNNVDLDNTKKKIDMYQKLNKDTIVRNKMKLTREQEELEEALEVEKQDNEQKRLLIQKEELFQQKMKRKNKQELLDQLETSRLPASILLAQHKGKTTQIEMQLEKAKPAVTFSTGIKMGHHISSVPIPKLEESLYRYQPIHIETLGPEVPHIEILGRQGYLNHVRATSPQDLAGGYTSSLACHRALQDAFSGLFWQAY